MGIFGSVIIKLLFLKMGFFCFIILKIVLFKKLILLSLFKVLFQTHFIRG